MFENSVLRRIFGLKRDEVTREWRKLHNEEPNDLYCSPSIVWVIKSRGDVMGGARSTFLSFILLLSKTQHTFTISIII